MRAWISFALLNLFHDIFADPWSDRVLYRHFDLPEGGPFKIPVMGSVTIFIDMFINDQYYRYDPDLAHKTIEIQIFSISPDFNESDPFSKIEQLGDSIFYRSYSENIRMPEWTKVHFQTDRYQGFVLVLIDSLYRGVIDLTKRTNHEILDGNIFYFFQFTVKCLPKMVGKYCQIYCDPRLTEISFCKGGRIFCQLGWFGTEYIISHRLFKGRKIDDTEVDFNIHNECEMQILCFEPRCPNDDCYQHSPVNTFCKSWFKPELMGNKTTYYIGETVQCYVKIASNVTVPDDLALEAHIENDTFLKIHRTENNMAKVKFIPKKAQVTCTVQASTLYFSEVYEITIKTPVPPCHMYPFNETGMEMQLITASVPIQFKASQQTADSVNLNVSLRYATDYAGVVLYNNTITFNSLAKDGIYIISCSTHLLNSNSRVIVDHPIRISRPPQEIEIAHQQTGPGNWLCPNGSFTQSTNSPLGVDVTESLITITEIARGSFQFICIRTTADLDTLKTIYKMELFGPATYVHIEPEQSVETGSSLRCHSNAHPDVLVLRVWTIRIGDVIEDEIYANELNLRLFRIPDNSKIHVNCTVVYFGKDGIQNITATSEVTVESSKIPVLRIESPQQRADVGHIFLACFLSSIVPLMLMLVVFVHLILTSNDSDNTIVLNCQFYVKYPQFMRRLRNVWPTQDAITRTQIGLHGTAYLRDWRSSQVILPTALENRKGILENDEEETNNSDIHHLNIKTDPNTILRTKFKIVNELDEVEKNA